MTVTAIPTSDSQGLEARHRSWRSLRLAGSLLRPVSIVSVMAVAVTTWRDWLKPPTFGIDPSWMAALNMTARGAAHTSEPLAFTYGPWGFLTEPLLFYRGTAVVSLTFTVVVHILTSALAVKLWRRVGLGSLTTVAAAYVTMLCVVRVSDADVLPMLVAVWVCSQESRVSSEARHRYVAGVSILAGGFLLVKFSAGLALGLIALCMTLTARGNRFRLLAVQTAATAGTLIVLFAVAGYSPARLPRFFDISLEITKGYPKYMAARVGDFVRDFVLAGVLSAVVMAVVLAAKPIRASWRSLLLLLPPLIFGFKHSFVRFDTGHAYTYFALLLLGCVLLLGFGRRSAPLFGRAAIAGVLIVAVAMVVSFSGRGLPAFLNPGPSLEALSSQARDIVIPSRLTNRIVVARAKLRAHYGLDALLPLLAGQRVDIEPFEAMVAWAYPEMRWTPVPIFQRYAAYTPALDAINAGVLGDDRRAPSRILQQMPAAIDKRDPNFETPETVLALMCHYRELAVSDKWQVLGRVANRCGAKRSIGTIRTRLGQEFPVPQAPPGHFVVANIENLGLTPIEGLATMLYQAPSTSLALNGYPGGARLASAEGASPFLVSVPDSIGWSSPFAPGSRTRTMRLRRSGFLADRHRSLEVHFAVIPINEPVPGPTD